MKLNVKRKSQNCANDYANFICVFAFGVLPIVYNSCERWFTASGESFLCIWIAHTQNILYIHVMKLSLIHFLPILFFSRIYYAIRGNSSPIQTFRIQRSKLSIPLTQRTHTTLIVLCRFFVVFL